ncbi:MAG: glycosyltransferase family 4 protein [Pseudomonadota bacterium]
MTGTSSTPLESGVDRPRLTIVTLYFHPEPTGSAPQLALFARWAVQQGIDVRVITARPHYPSRKVFDGYGDGSKDCESWEGVDIIRLKSPIHPGDGFIGRLTTEMGFASALAGFLWKQDDWNSPRLSLCPSPFVPLVSGIRRPSHHTAMVHDLPSGLAGSMGLGGRMAKIIRRLERWSLGQADTLVTLSDAMEQNLKRLGLSQPVRVIPPMVDTHALAPLPEPNGPITLLYSGALGFKQGFGQLLDLAQDLQELDPSIRLVLRGEGGQEDRLRDQIKHRGLKQISIKPLGPVDGLRDMLAEGHIHLLPQEPGGASAALPSKLFASMAVGRPVVATANPGSPVANWIERSGGGIAVPPGNQEALAQAVLTLTRDPERRKAMGRAGRQVAERSVSIDPIGRDLLDALNLTSQIIDDPAKGA